MATKKPAINYTNRDFQSIRADLESYVRRYYPDNYRDFTEASFGAMMLDTVAYVGDMLSFYTDYQANESFLDTAIEYDNVLKLSRQMGYRYSPYPSSFGVCDFYITVPVEAGSQSPDENYMPILRKGSTFLSSGGSVFSLLEDVNFALSENPIVVANQDVDTGNPSTYAVRAAGQVVSGELAVQEVQVSSYTPFLRIGLVGENISEVVSVFDDKGNQYFEVDYLSQDVLYVSVINRNSNNSTVPYILKPVSVSRRFRVDSTPDGLYLQFGQGSEETPVEVKDPSEVILQLHGKDHVSDTSFDPSILNQTDNLGVAPSNTTLTIIYRINREENVNAAAQTITRIGTVDFSFPADQQGQLSETKIDDVTTSLAVLNEDPIIGDVGVISTDEIKERARANFASQYRAVTKQDYIGIAYNMPSKYGKFKRVALELDSDSYNQRNLNYYVISEDIDGFLATSNNTLKNNLKTWINQYKMINDTIDVLDAKICNVGIEYKIVPFPGTNKYDLLVEANTTLRDAFTKDFYIGEPIIVTDIYQILKSVPNLLDVVDVQLTVKSGANYADSPISIGDALSADGRFLFPPSDTIFEFKYPDLDIGGTIQ
tara:strand:- start:32771 stop:34567 length:1797 start_codon:yes stop_codon:yes gene_type:complete